MLKPAQMSKLRVVVLDQYLEDVMREFSKLGNVHILDVKTAADAKNLESVIENKTSGRSAELLGRIYYLLDILGIKEERDFFGSLKKEPRRMPWKSNKSEKQLSKVEELVSEMEKIVLKKSDKLVELGEEKARLAPEKTVLEALSRLSVDSSTLGESRFLYAVAGSIAPQDLDKLEEALKKHLIEYVLKEANKSERIAMVLLTPKAHKQAMDKLLEGLDFQRFVLSPGTASSDLTKISHRLSEIETEKKQLEADLAEAKKKYAEKLFSLREIVQIEKDISDTNSMMAKTKRVYVLEGWVPDKNYSELEKKIEEISHGHAIVKATRPVKGETVPTKLDNPGIFKPFEVLVETFGLPSYKELDPTPILAITFPLFYGLMFGDVGHGLILVLIGLVLAKLAKTSRGVYSLGVIVMTCGIFAMLFGFIYGEMFGMGQEEQLKLLGFKLPLFVKDAAGTALISPLADATHTIEFLKLAILVGVVHVGSGMVLGFINKISEKQYLSALAGPLPKLWLYYGAVYLFMTYWTDFGKWGQNLGTVIMLIPVPLVIILFSEVIQHLPKFDMHHLPTQLGEGGFEVFDTSLIFLSNSISYSRIFALALVHGGLFLALFSVAEPLNALPLVGPLVWLLVIIAGTAGIIALESLIVFLHSLRLHYYEWFTKFYAADGVKFRPFKAERVYTRTEE